MSFNGTEKGARKTEKAIKVILAAFLFVFVYVSILFLLPTPEVATFSGSGGVTTTGSFAVKKSNWDIFITYFKTWGPFWSLRIEVYRQGFDESPVFSTHAIRFTESGGEERAELATHHNLPPGTYYLKVYAENVNWTIKIVEW